MVPSGRQRAVYAWMIQSGLQVLMLTPWPFLDSQELLTTIRFLASRRSRTPAAATEQVVRPVLVSNDDCAAE